MSLLFEPSVATFLFEPDANVDQLFMSDFLSYLDEASWPTTEIVQDAVPIVPEPSSRSLKRVRPRSSVEDLEPKPKRGRGPSAARPRLRNKGKIEILRREIENLKTELENLQQMKQNANPHWHNTEAMWKVIALKQSKEREQAEQQNKTLKRLLTAQSTLTVSLSGVLNQWRDLPIPDMSLSI
ncbi:hypothetical protein PHMEG_00040688 [Phytophthora megakarya]|uniref:Uncharacterized protein n=1 Tax=Phytophthora megakarya TaxID=4795 RepID=A0A225UD26_9STRA|nr:hypothetical protein PHMEG_00040688 [Phytophthora megakarya]